MKDYKIFARKLLLFLLIVVLFDLVIGGVLNWLYFKQKSGLLYRATYSMETTTSQGLVFGSSRANHHYEPGVLKQRLNQGFYNAGRDGNSIFYHYAVLQSVLKRYTPQTVILDFNPQEFIVSRDSYDRLSSLFPYYRSHPEIRPVVNLKSKLEKYKLYSGIYPFNSSLFTILVGCLEANKGRARDIEGYLPLNKQLTDTIKTSPLGATYVTDSMKIEIYKSFIDACKKAGVNLYIAASPYYIQSPVADYSVRLAMEIARNESVPFYDFTRDNRFLTQPALFSDPSHLNDTGARLFSSILADSILTNPLKFVK